MNNISDKDRISLPRVTIMIPTYNQEQFIGDAIESALAQDYGNLEIIVSDDCSTDATGEIVQPYLSDKRVKYFRNPENLGRVRNYQNTLYNYASGDWVLNLDGDDFYTDPSFVSYAINLIQKNKNVVFLLASCEQGVKRAKKISHKALGETELLMCGKDYFLDYFKIDDFYHHSLVYNRKIAKEIGFYTHDSLICDFHSAMRLALRGDIILSSRKVACWRIHENNSSFLEIESLLEKNISAVSDMAKDAHLFFPPQKCNTWEKKMISLRKEHLTFSVAISGHSMKDIIFVFCHLKPKKTHVILFVRMILRYLGLNKTK